MAENMIMVLSRWTLKSVYEKEQLQKEGDFTALIEQGICDAHKAFIAVSLSAEERKQDVNSL